MRRATDGVCLDRSLLPLFFPSPQLHLRHRVLGLRHDGPFPPLGVCRCKWGQFPSLSPCAWLSVRNSFGRRNVRKQEDGRSRNRGLRATRRDSPYEVLGVPPSATPQDIKRAYRRLALKYHPDVNKAANAQEKFMRIKHAYNSLINSDSQKKTNFSNSRSDYSGTAYGKSGGQKAEEAEEFYGFGEFLRDVQITIGDLLRDLQTEFENWEANARSQERPKSLWEELADIGEEFVEFLEKELNISDSDSNLDYGGDKASEGNRHQKSGTDQTGGVQSEANKGGSIEDNTDEIEAALAQLKKELGL